MKVLLPITLLFSTSIGALAAAPPEAHISVYETDHRGAYLGVGVSEVTEENAGALKLKEARGAVVVAVDHDGPAASFIREQDVILELNHEQVANLSDVRRILHAVPAGAKLDILLSRDGNPVNVQVVTGDRAAHARNMMPGLDKLQQDLSNMQPVVVMGNGFADFGDLDTTMHGALAGALVESVGPQLAHYFGAKDGTGILVKEVRENTAAAHAGLRAGDFIVRADGDAVNSQLDWNRKLRESAGKTVKVEVLRYHGDVKLTLVVPARTQGRLQGLGDLDSQLAQLESPAVEAAVRAQMDSVQKQLSDHAVDAEHAMQQAEKALQSAEVQRAMSAAETASRNIDSGALAAQVAASQKELENIQPEIDKAMRQAADELDKLNMQ